MFAKSAPRDTFLILTSMVDIVFLLLIFFMVTCTFYVANSIDMNVSVVNEAKINVDHMPIVLTAKPNQMVLWHETLFPLDKLSTSLAYALKTDPKAPILIKPGDQSTVQDLVVLLDIVNKSGGKSVSLVDDDSI
ncbi:MAG: biopolymer transporter ExbD [Alphaproteobacteria bacterium]|nr:biopolymer transporter ExbD [Alphaproteobacteria bacterium]